MARRPISRTAPVREMPRRRRQQEPAVPPVKAAGRPALVKQLATHWRLWATLPKDAHVLLVLAKPQPKGSPLDATVLAAVPRPTFPRGVCQSCGCTFTDPCPGGCAWTDNSETLCTACEGR